MTVTTARVTRRRSRRERRRSGFPLGIVLAVAGGLSYVAGFAGGLASPLWVDIFHAVVLAGGVAWVFYRERSQESVGLSVGAGLLCTVVAMGVSRFAEGAGVPLYAASYLAVGFIAAIQVRKAGWVTIGFAVALVVGSHLTGTAPGLEPASAGGFTLVDPVPWSYLLARSAFMTTFGLFALYAYKKSLLERWSTRGESDETERDDLLERAREFRLLNAGRLDSEGSRREDVEGYAVMDAVEAVERSIFESMNLLKISLDCHTCILLWFDVGREQLRIKELVSDSDRLVEDGLDPAQGVLGSIARCREPVLLDDLRPGFRGLSYYRGEEPVRQFLGVPLIEEGHMRGILCVDRLEDAPFSERERELVQMVSESMLRSIENERIYKNVETTKFELGQFFRASRRLNSVLSMEEVFDAALRSAADVVSYDFGAVTLCEDGGHRIAEVDAVEDFGGEGEAWRGRRFDDNSGLVSMAVKNQHYLPYGGRLRDGDTVVFTREEALSNLESLLVLPLITRDEAIGTLVVGTAEPGGISAERREMLEVIANQVAVSLQNARLYARMEQLATTDELTGLPNRRTFDDKLEEAVARHSRSERKFGLIMLDIDHFKAVNDTYGHAVGDAVLEDVAEVLEESVREIDVPARYGGEEFAVILEETDGEGIRQVAERIRRGVRSLEFQAGRESFQCTASLGFAVWPDDATDEHAIVEVADEALYASKENGRDRVTARSDLR